MKTIFQNKIVTLYSIICVDLLENQLLLRPLLYSHELARNIEDLHVATHKYTFSQPYDNISL